MSLIFEDAEQRIEIKLLSVSAENVGTGKQIDRIAGNLIAFACRMAIKKYGSLAAVSLVPKTLLRSYYVSKYGMEEAGKQIFLFGHSLFKILKEYDDEQE
ncbi:MAG: hypothetical protein JWQ09_350 [Segetibacter sp.]|nr:hypothetical protein [Segetibacter sp.]